MNQVNVLNSEYRVDALDGFAQPRGVGDIEAGGEEMAGIEAIADRDLAFARREIADGSQFFEPAADLRSGPDSVFEQHRETVETKAEFSLRHSENERGHPFFARRTFVVARMDDEILGADRVGALEFAAEGVDRTFSDDGIERSQVDQVAYMNGQRREIVLFAGFAEGADIGGCWRDRSPHAGAGGEDLEGIGSKFCCFDCCVFEGLGARSVDSDAQGLMVARPSKSGSRYTYGFMLVIGSRGSQLALWQANYIQDKLRARGFETRIEIIKTTGDKITDVPLARVGSKGLFTKEIEEALLDGSIDLAVHSLKDLPTELPEGLTLAAVPLRADARDAIVGKQLQELPPGSIVGTSSLRRIAQLKRIRPDLKYEPIRGNLDTRLRKLDEGQYQAIVLAAAGLTRLGWKDRIAHVFPPKVLCPAPGQGALGIETRLSGPGHDACAPLDDPWTRLAVTAEREMLAELGGGCQIPIGAFAEIEEGTLKLLGIIAAEDGSEIVRGTAEAELSRPRQIGRELGRALLEKGGARILEKTVGL